MSRPRNSFHEFRGERATKHLKLVACLSQKFEDEFLGQDTNRRGFAAGMRRYAFLLLTAYGCMYIKVLATVVPFLREEPPSYAAWT